MHVDSSVPLWAFFALIGPSSAIQINRTFWNLESLSLPSSNAQVHNFLKILQFFLCFLLKFHQELLNFWFCQICAEKFIGGSILICWNVRNWTWSGFYGLCNLFSEAKGHCILSMWAFVYMLWLCLQIWLGEWLSHLSPANSRRHTCLQTLKVQWPQVLV